VEYLILGQLALNAQAPLGTVLHIEPVEPVEDDSDSNNDNDKAGSVDSADGQRTSWSSQIQPIASAASS
jgi:hypothetical protein